MEVAWQVPSDRIVQPYLTAAHHVGQQKGGEYFGGRADLENRLRCDRPIICHALAAPCDDPFAVRRHHTYRHADGALLHIDALSEDVPDSFIIIGLNRMHRSSDHRRADPYREGPAIQHHLTPSNTQLL
jgi:hypothetical protein